jgi:T-complex protein 1 subunit beta
MLTTNTDAIGGTLPSVLAQGASEEKAENARITSFLGAIAVADLVKSTLGPKGMVTNKN